MDLIEYLNATDIVEQEINSDLPIVDFIEDLQQSLHRILNTPKLKEDYGMLFVKESNELCITYLDLVKHLYNNNILTCDCC